MCLYLLLVSITACDLENLLRNSMTSSHIIVACLNLWLEHLPMCLDFIFPGNNACLTLRVAKSGKANYIKWCHGVVDTIHERRATETLPLYTLGDSYPQFAVPLNKMYNTLRRGNCVKVMSCLICDGVYTSLPSFSLSDIIRGDTNHNSAIVKISKSSKITQRQTTHVTWHLITFDTHTHTHIKFWHGKNLGIRLQ